MDGAVDAQDTGVKLVPITCAIGNSLGILESHLAYVNAIKEVAVDVVAELARQRKVRPWRVAVIRHCGERRTGRVGHLLWWAVQSMWVGRSRRIVEGEDVGDENEVFGGEEALR